MLALKQIIARPQIMKEQAKAFYISFGLTGGIALLFALAPRFFFPSYVSSMEMQALQSIPADQLAPLIANLEEVRVSIFTSDAWRSFFVVSIGAVLLWLYGMGKLKSELTIGVLLLLCLVEMWNVNKRYLYDAQFVPQTVRTESFRPTETDKAILEDKTLDYRVLNLASNTFNENNTSYWHMAKVDASAFPVLNMLNTRYFIFPLQGGKTMPIQNPYTLGNAWFVDKVQYVNNANEEIESLHKVMPAKVAVVVAYEPNDLKYEVSSEKGGVVVFSEIYYPGWQAYIDGVEAPHGRADYILRAMNVPAGKHTVEFKFDPKSLHTTETIAFVALGLLAMAVLLLLVLQGKALWGKKG